MDTETIGILERVLRREQEGTEADAQKAIARALAIMRYGFAWLASDEIEWLGAH